jgi:hypothetical protein
VAFLWSFRPHDLNYSLGRIGWCSEIGFAAAPRYVSTVIESLWQKWQQRNRFHGYPNLTDIDTRVRAKVDLLTELKRNYFPPAVAVSGLTGLDPRPSVAVLVGASALAMVIPYRARPSDITVPLTVARARSPKFWKEDVPMMLKIGRVIGSL